MYKIIGADQKQYGPVSADELRQWIAEGRANAQTLIQAEGQPDWRPLSSFPEFATAAQPIPSGIPLSSAMPVPDESARNLVSGPATCLLIVGILCALGALANVLSNLLGFGRGAFGPGAQGANLPPQVAQWMQMMGGTMGVVLNLISLAISAFVIFASTKLRKLESYGLVITAIILAMIPCTAGCCCVLGLPVGIWSLVILSKPEVKSAFH
jgi:hypothetical protein